METASLIRRVCDRWPSIHLEIIKQVGDSPEFQPYAILKPPERTRRIPTFDRNVYRGLSPMLRDRFQLASDIVIGTDVWLGIKRMSRVIRGRSMSAMLRGLREHWEGSAPQRFTDDRLGVFAIAPSIPEEVVLLVWVSDNSEPEFWEYLGMNSTRYKNLDAYLKSQLK